MFGMRVFFNEQFGLSVRRGMALGISMPVYLCDFVTQNKSVDLDASGLPSGVYYYRSQVGDYVETKKLLLLR